MKSLSSGILFWFPVGGLLLIIFALPVNPQSQALDAQIDGVVIDGNGAAVPIAAVTAINVDTGARRTSTSSESGIFRLPTLSLGTYSVIVEYSGFKRFERHGIILSAGQTASVTISLEPGTPAETVIVTSDTEIADASRFSIGSLVNSRDARNLPLVSRNPHNFILLQPGVHGRSVKDPFAIDLSSNGLRRRVGYQIDGGFNNESNSGGMRFNLISEVFVKEIQLLSNGYSAEFGNTAGAVVNVITPSGTNDLAGSATFLFRPAGLSSKPFGFETGTASNVNGYGATATIGGPILKDRWHFYAGYEWTRRISTTPIGVEEADRIALIAAGIPVSIFVNSKATSDTLPYLLLRTDAKISDNTRVNLRYNRFDSGLRYTGSGGLSTTERSFDLTGFDHALAAQAVTSFSETFFNEFRFQFAKRITSTVANDVSGHGLTIWVNAAANFGPSPNLGTVNDGSTTQFQNAVIKVVDAHSMKIGGSINFISDQPTEEVSASYTFATARDYAAAINGINRRGYTRYRETFGDSEIPYRSVFLNFFVQDDWSVTRRLRLGIGLRYDHYRPPEADPVSPLPYSRKFGVDTNNFAPRLGLAYLLRDGKYRTVIRAGTGMHYDPPFLRMYRRAALNNGNPRYFNFTFGPGDPGAPDFPNKLGVFPPGAIVPPRNIDAVAPDFKTMYAIHSNLQVEQAITDNMSLTAGYLYTIARRIPVTRNINCLPVGGILADGRPIYGTATIACSNRVIPEYRLIMMTESVGNLNYHGLFLHLVKRFSLGFQFNASYTLSRARDDAPEEIGPGAITLSDPSNRAIDRGNAYGQIGSTFSTSIIARPKFSVANRFLNAVLNNNQIGIIVFADSGENFNITTIDLNRDGVLGPDRPVGIPRNSGRLPPFLGVDARYSRFARFRENLSLEFYAEATNIFNAKQVSFYDGTSLPANLINTSTGELLGPLPDFGRNSATWRESRQVQFGAKIHF